MHARHKLRKCVQGQSLRSQRILTQARGNARGGSATLTPVAQHAARDLERVHVLPARRRRRRRGSAELWVVLMLLLVGMAGGIGGNGRQRQCCRRHLVGQVQAGGGRRRPAQLQGLEVGVQ